MPIGWGCLCRRRGAPAGGVLLKECSAGALADSQGKSADSAVVVASEPADDAITKQQHISDCEKLAARMTEIETYTELDQEETNKFHLKYALYRIKACLVSQLLIHICLLLIYISYIHT